MVRSVVAAMAAMLLTACAGAEAPAANAASAEGAEPVEDATPAPVASAPAGEKPLLAIDGEGLRVIDASTGRAVPLAFGTPADRAIAAISASLGPPSSRAPNPDCPIGPVDTATWDQGLSIVIQDGRFAGWYGAVDLKTMSGIGFGSTRQALSDAYDAEIAPGTLGVEFAAGGMSGILESDAPDARISDIWAGISCVAR